MRKAIFFICFCLFGVLSKSQTLELPKNIQSPNASSLGKYGDISTNLYTGRVDLNIPLYSIKEGGVPLNIALSYDTGGVRVNDVPGWTGQNWTLQAGGVITRTQRGWDFDECKNKDLGIDFPSGFMYFKSDLNSSDWNSNNKLRSLIGNYLTSASYRKDYEPDIFTFNFMGYTGKFFMGNDGEWKVISNHNLKVEINESDYIQPLNILYFGNPNPTQSSNTRWNRSKVIGKIKITDDKGNYYIFGKTQNDIEFTIPSYENQSGSNLFSNAWYLSEVYNKYDNRIYYFNYERGDDQVFLYNNASEIKYRRDKCGMYGEAVTPAAKDLNMKVAGSLIKPVYLKSIITKAGIVITLNSSNHSSLKYDSNDPVVLRTLLDKQEKIYTKMASEGQAAAAWEYFNYFYWYTVHTPQNSGDPNIEDPLFKTGDYLTSLKNLFQKWNWRKLTNISIKYGNNTIKNIAFKYNDTPNKRLKLMNVILDDIYKYSFDYYNFDMLPSFTSKSFDHFGYFTGRNYNDNPVDVNSHFSNRETDSDYVKYGALTKITYPTGGNTTLEYEPHSYSLFVNADRKGFTQETGIVGGLRIKKMVDDNNIGHKIVKEYIYQNSLTNTASSGILLLKNQYLIQDYPGTTTCGSNFYTTAFNMNSIIPLSNFSGNHIEYPIVIERQTDINGNYLGYTIYHFSTFNDYKDNFAGTIQPSFSIFDPKTDFSFKRGHLKLKQVFDKENIKKYEEENIYYSSDAKKGRGLGYDFFVIGYATMPSGDIVPDGNQAMRGNAYEIYYSDFNLTNKKIRTYRNDGTYIEEIENYNYMERENFGDSFLTTKDSQTSNGQYLSEVYKYTFDKNGTEPYTTLTNRREFSILEKNRTLGTEKISSSKIDYTVLPIIDINNTVISNNSFPQAYSESKGNNPLEQKLIIDKYDSDGNVRQAHYLNGVYVYYFYAYGNRFPFLKIEGTQILPESNINVGGYIPVLKNLLDTESSTPAQILAQQRRTINSFPNHKLVFYTYNPQFGVVTSITQSNKSVEYYNYDSIGRLINVKDEEGNLLKDYSYQIKAQ